MTIKGVEYVTGMGRNTGEEKLKTHLYRGTMDNPGLPMCRRGWNRSDGERYSIFRNNVSNAGICKTCLARAEKKLPGVEAVLGSHKTKWL
jgi:hypothetical protein